MTPIGLAVALSRHLPGRDLERLARAAAQGEMAVRQLQAAAAGAALRDACDDVLSSGPSPELAGALRAASAVRRDQQDRVEVVWSGPDSDVATSRLTASTVLDLLGRARHSILLVGFAVHTEPRVAEALEAALDRRVEVTLLLERTVDNASYAGVSVAFPQMAVRRLAWPGDVRPAGASLHAKVIAVDDRWLFVGSANITVAALDRNLECGVLVAGTTAARVRQHVESLLMAGTLRRV